jgi:SAM-dependent methyltransferase
MSIEKWTSGTHYDRWMGRWSGLLARELLNWLGLPRHLRWLDVCCGSGVLTEAIVESFAPAWIAGIDASADQISFARDHRAGPRVRFETADALQLPFAADSFDVAGCGLGLNFLPDPERALQEMRRVVVPRGTISAYVWDYAEGARFLREFWDAAAAIDQDAPQHDQGRRFPLCNPEPLRELFEGAGMSQVDVVGLSITTRFASFDDYWQPLFSGQGSAPNYLATRSEPTRNAIRDRLRHALPIDSDGVIALPARAWAVRGTC